MTAPPLLLCHGAVGAPDATRAGRDCLCTHNTGYCSQGKVVSTKATQTVVVAVETFVPHYLYKKRIRKTTRFAAHDEEEKCTVGDYVEIDPSKPISKTKRFTIGEILRKSDL